MEGTGLLFGSEILPIASWDVLTPQIFFIGALIGDSNIGCRMYCQADFPVKTAECDYCYARGKGAKPSPRGEVFKSGFNIAPKAQSRCWAIEFNPRNIQYIHPVKFNGPP
jgi:hypothetical protein